ncbi:WD40 repeat domain-containing protein, partial [Nocardia sp. NPDC058705]|uniref:WD40 repeat domain-containing protein n=1 Tax=Nocardia sp. NPDC058705 TaxID=3346609 RepID=UPI00369C4D30
AVAAVALPDGRTLLASGSDDRTVRLWDPITGHPHGTPLTGHTHMVTAVAAVVLLDGRTLLASGSHDDTVRLWDLSDTRSWSCKLTVDVGARVEDLCVLGLSAFAIALGTDGAATIRVTEAVEHGLSQRSR